MTRDHCDRDIPGIGNRAEDAVVSNYIARSSHPVPKGSIYIGFYRQKLTKQSSPNYKRPLRIGYSKFDDFKECNLSLHRSDNQKI